MHSPGISAPLAARLPARLRRNHSLEFTDSSSDAGSDMLQNENDVDIHAMVELLGSVDVDKLFDDVVVRPRSKLPFSPTLSSVALASVPDYSDESFTKKTNAMQFDEKCATVRLNSQPSTTEKHQPKSRKELIIHLRKLAGQLIDQVEELKAAPTQALSDGNLLHQPGSSLWKFVAIRQLGRRRKAEEESVQLREMLEMQVQEAKCLQRILKRRRKIQIMENMLGMKRCKADGKTSVPTDNSEIFATMLQDIDEVYARVDSHFTNKGFGDLPCPGQKRKVNRNIISGDFYERLQKNVLPFHFRKAETVVWQVLMEHGVEDVKCLKDFVDRMGFRDQQSEESRDTMTTSYFSTITGNEDISGAQVRKAARKFVEADRIVFICNVLAEPKAKYVAESVGYQLQSTLQIVIQHGNGTVCGDDATQLSMHFSVLRHDLGIPTRSIFRKPRHLDGCIALWDKLIPSIPFNVESLLIDEVCRTSASKNRV